MKKNLLGLLALVLAIGVSSFTVKRAINYYLVYDGTNVQTSMSSYAAPTTVQPAHAFTGVAILNWFRVVDVDSDGVEASEFAIDFEAFDVQNDASNTLNDETADISGRLDLKNKP